MHQVMPKTDNKIVRRASYVSLAVSIVVVSITYYAYQITGSSAVLSDAMESIVNVIAAMIAIAVVRIAVRPADKDHPYGHGKLEYFSAAFEGGLITFAGIVIIIDSVDALIKTRTLEKLDLGLLIVLGAGIMNALLGFYLRKVGTEHNSEALKASGAHVLSDFWTSLGVVGGLLAVKVTGLTWIDPVIAIIVALYLIRTGSKILRESADNLMDAEDEDLVNELVKIFTKNWFPGMIRAHALKIIRSGKFHHIDAHVVVPEFWDVKQTHDQTEKFERKIIDNYSYDAEVHFHVDPCRQAYCRVCDLKDCSVRQEPFGKKRPLTASELVDPDEPKRFT